MPAPQALEDQLGILDFLDQSNSKQNVIIPTYYGPILLLDLFRSNLVITILHIANKLLLGS